MQPPPPQPFVRQAGAGPTVVCLHSNASSSTQWRGLMDLLSPAWTVAAPDSYGSGKSPDWPSAHTITLDDEVRLVQHLVQGAPDRPVLVGHSYGGAVALMAALRHPHKVRALVLYEPTLFALEEAQVPAPNGVDGIRHAVARAAQALDDGDADAAAGHFIDFWMGPGSWAATPAERKTLLAGKVEDMINTVVRQIAFYDFECKLHAARAQGELTPEDINALWMSVQAQSLGDAFEFMDGYETFWAYIPHFVHSPFYVYAYAFGDGLVNALYAAYASGLPDFQEKYFAMLKAGGSMHHKELLAPFGLDASDPKFWDKGLSMIAGFIDELEAMEA